MIKLALKMKYFLYFMTTVAVFSLACNKTQGQKTSPASQASTQKSPSITIDGVALEVEIVQDAESRQLGLMYREELAEDRGMLFVFESPQILSFWMRNTYIPLDIAFIDANGVIVDIQHMEPLDESINYISSAPALYALEVNAGWFKKNGLKTGGQVQF